MDLKVFGLLVTMAALSPASVVPGMGDYPGSVRQDNGNRAYVPAGQVGLGRGMNYDDVRYSSEIDKNESVMRKDTLTSSRGVGEMVDSVSDHTNVKQSPDGTDMARELEITSTSRNPNGTAEVFTSREAGRLRNGTDADGVNDTYGKKEADLVYGVLRPNDVSEVYAVTTTDEGSQVSRPDGSNSAYLASEDGTLQTAVDANGAAKVNGNLETHELYQGDDAAGNDELYVLDEATNGRFMTDGKGLTEFSQTSSATGGSDADGVTEVFALNTTDNAVALTADNVDATMVHHGSNGSYESADIYGNEELLATNGVQDSMKIKDEDGEMTFDSSNTNNLYGLADPTGLKMAYEGNETGHAIGMKDKDGEAKISVNKVDEIYGTTDDDGVDRSHKVNGVNKTMMISDADGTVALNVGKVDEVHAVSDATGVKEGYVSNAVDKTLMIGDGRPTTGNVDDLPCAKNNNKVRYGTIPVQVGEYKERTSDKEDNRNDMEREDILNILVPSVNKKEKKPLTTISANNAASNEDNVDDADLAAVMKLLDLTGATPVAKKEENKPIITVSTNTAADKEDNVDDAELAAVMKLLGLPGTNEATTTKKKPNKVVVVGSDRAPRKDAETDEIGLTEIMNLLGLAGPSKSPDDTRKTNKAAATGTSGISREAADTAETELDDVMSVLSLLGITDPAPVDKKKENSAIMTIGADNADGNKGNSDDLDLAAVMNLLGLSGTSEAQPVTERKANKAVVIDNDGASRKGADEDEMGLTEIMNLLGLSGVSQAPPAGSKKVNKAVVTGRNDAPRKEANTDELDVMIALGLLGMNEAPPVGSKNKPKPVVIGANGGSRSRADTGEAELMDIMSVLGLFNTAETPSVDHKKANPTAITVAPYEAPRKDRNTNDVELMSALELLGMLEPPAANNRKATNAVNVRGINGAPGQKDKTDEREVMQMLSALGLLGEDKASSVNRNTANEADIIIEIDESPRRKPNTNEMNLMRAMNPSDALGRHEASLEHKGKVTETVVVVADDGPPNEANTNEMEMKTAAEALNYLAHKITDLYESGNSNRLRQIFGGNKIKKMDLHVTIDMDDDQSPSGRHNGKNPLFLTPYIESGSLHQGRSVALVRHTEMLEVRSYSGYLTVDKKYNSHLFFWFFPAKVNPEKAPVMLLLQGGPGVSSLSGLFMGNGPFRVTEDITVEMRESSWTTTHNVIYIDNPVGTGYSFTEQEAGYRREEIQVSEDLYVAMGQFYQLFPEYRGNELYIVGESYAANYIPSLANTIHKQNPTAKNKMNLQGIAIGNSFADPIDRQHHGHFHSSSEETVRLQKYMKRVDVKQAIHVGDREYIYESERVETYLKTQVTKSGASALATPPQDYRVMIFSGEMEMVTQFTLGE